MASKVVVTCPVCGLTQPLGSVLGRPQSHELDPRDHLITSEGRGKIRHTFFALMGEDAQLAVTAIRARLLDAADAWGLLGDDSEKVRALELLARVRTEFSLFQRWAFKAMKQSAARAGKPMVRAAGRPRKVRGALVADGGLSYRATVLPGDQRVDNSKVVDDGTQRKEWNG